MNELPAGIYKHYKGELVCLLGVAQHSETGERLIAYIPLNVRTGARITVRPYEMFFERVVVKGQHVPRFTHIGQEVSDVFAGFYDPLGGYTGADRDDS